MATETAWTVVVDTRDDGAPGVDGATQATAPPRSLPVSPGHDGSPDEQDEHEHDRPIPNACNRTGTVAHSGHRILQCRRGRCSADRRRPGCSDDAIGQISRRPPLRSIGSLSAMRFAVTYGDVVLRVPFGGIPVYSRELWNLAVISGTKSRYWPRCNTRTSSRCRRRRGSGPGRRPGRPCLASC